VIPSFDYRTWQQQHSAIPPRTLLVATKAGVFAHGQADPAAEMLAAAMRQVDGRVVVSLSSGNGMVGAAAARAGAAQVWMTDRHGLAVDASRRTLAANALRNAEVRLGHGTTPLDPAVIADVVAVRVVPERIGMHQLLHDAMRVLRPGGRCYVAGGNHEGAKSAARLLERYCGAIRLEAQRDGHRLVSGVRPAVLPAVDDAEVTHWCAPDAFHEVPVTAHGVSFTTLTRPGVFSWEHLDEATADLLDVLGTFPTLQQGVRVLDLGCGAGVLGTFAALRSAGNEVTLLDEDSESVRCARATLQRAGAANARALVSDIASAVLTETFDLVLTNPPFHVGKQTNLDVPRQFIRDAHAVLRSGGELCLVANRTLPYEAVITEQFGQVLVRHDGRHFKVLSAIKR
jgi:16S rRNA (guanine1207-N2)-methyltransferase